MDPSQREMFTLLTECEMAVTRLSQHFPMSRTAVSKHVRILSDAELVSVEKYGREKRYKLQPNSFMELKEWLSFF